MTKGSQESLKRAAAGSTWVTAEDVLLWHCYRGTIPIPVLMLRVSGGRRQTALPVSQKQGEYSFSTGQSGPQQSLMTAK